VEASLLKAGFVDRCEFHLSYVSFFLATSNKYLFRVFEECLEFLYYGVTVMSSGTFWFLCSCYKCVCCGRRNMSIGFLLFLIYFAGS
jgi:hypothetical protein